MPIRQDQTMPSLPYQARKFGTSLTGLPLASWLAELIWGAIAVGARRRSRLAERGDRSSS
jgi:hypothetical protein